MDQEKRCFLLKRYRKLMIERIYLSEKKSQAELIFCVSKKYNSGFRSNEILLSFFGSDCLLKKKNDKCISINDHYLSKIMCMLDENEIKTSYDFDRLKHYSFSSFQSFCDVVAAKSLPFEEYLFFCDQLINNNNNLCDREVKSIINILKCHMKDNSKPIDSLIRKSEAFSYDDNTLYRQLEDLEYEFQSLSNKKMRISNEFSILKRKQNQTMSLNCLIAKSEPPSYSHYVSYRDIINKNKQRLQELIVENDQIKNMLEEKERKQSQSIFSQFT